MQEEFPVKTKHLVTAAAAALLAGGAAWAGETLPLKSVNKAGEVIDAAMVGLEEYS